MPEHYTDFTSLAGQLDSGCLLLTPNHRTAVQVYEDYGQLLRTNKSPLISPSPDIFPVDIWLSRLYQEMFDGSDTLEALAILDSHQELALWKKVIRDSEAGNPLLNLQNAATQVMEAQRLLIQWQIPLNDLRVFQSRHHDYLDDSSVFLEWAAAYRKFSQDHGLVSFSELLELMLTQLTLNPGLIPKNIILLGFANPPPLYRQLFALLEQHANLQSLHLHRLSPEVCKKSYASTAEEILASAKWSKALLAQNSSIRIGIICNELQQQLPQFKRSFNAIFQPENEGHKAYFFNTGNPLVDDIPLLRQCVKLLQFNQTQLPTLELCSLLRSPLLLAAEQEAQPRAAMEMQLRKNADSQTRSADLRYLLSREERPWYCPLLQEALMSAEKLRRQQKKLQSLELWSVFFARQLAIFLQPDDETDSPALMLLGACSEALEELQNLSFIYPAVGMHEALKLFEQTLESQSSKAHRQEAPIQVFSARDAEGLRFTHLWFMGLSDLQWPEKRYSNPFIPLRLQREYEMPDSSPGLVYQGALDSLINIAASTAEEVLLSYPRTDDNGELLPSPLLDKIHSSQTMVHEDNSPITAQLHPQTLALYSHSQSRNPLENLTEASTLTLGDGEFPGGGVSLLANQAVCPFKAFAIHRLGARELPAINFGIPAFVLGNMLHQVLEFLWSRIESQEALLALPEARLESIISEAASQGVSYLQKKQVSVVQNRFAELENRRIRELLRRWLEVEKQRGPFTVSEREIKVNWQHAKLDLQFRIDRIDELPDKRFALIDYKTGAANSLKWDDQRPNSPQLLLYKEALTQQSIYQPVAALLYAEVAIDKLQYRGLSQEQGVYPKCALAEQNRNLSAYTWDSLQQIWQQSLQKLAQEFLDGYLLVEPKTSDSCKHCHLDAFCRIEEKLGEAE